VCAQAPGLYDSYRRQASGGQPTATVDPPVTPVVKAPPVPAPLIPEALQRDIVKTASLLSPGDRQQGLAAIAAALAELRDEAFLRAQWGLAGGRGAACAL
jgi:hypothetical protein